MNLTTNNFISNANLLWLPIVAFFVVLIFAAITGFYKGWKTALYYLITDWVAALIGVFVSGPILVAIANGIDTNQVSLGNYMAANPALAPTLLIIWIPLMRIISFTIHYFFLRKILRKMVIHNEIAAQVQNAPLRTRWLRFNTANRWVGVAVSLAGAAPMAIFTANAATLISGNNFFGTFSDAMVTATTFGLYQGTNNHAADIRDYFTIVNNDNINLVRRLLAGEAISAAELDAAFNELQTILTSDADTLRAVFKSLPAEATSSVYMNAMLASPNGLAPLSSRFSASTNQFNVLRQVLTRDFNWVLEQGEEGWSKIQAAYFA